MAIKIKKKKKYSILSFPGFDCSLIVDILNSLPDNPGSTPSWNIPSEPIDSVKNDYGPFFIGSEPLPPGQTYQENIQNLNQNEEDGEPSASAINEEYYAYKIYFVADLRKVLNSKYKIARVSIRTKLPQSTYSLFEESGTSPSIKEIIATINGARSRDIRQSMTISDREGLVLRKNIDLEHYINPKKIKNAASLSDHELFGTKEINQLVSPESVKKSGGNIALSQQIVGSSDTNLDTDVNSFSMLALEEIRSHGIDPAGAFFPSDNMSSSDPRKDGCFSEKEAPAMSDTIKYMNNSLRALALKTNGNNSSLMSTSDADTVKVVAVRKKVSDRMKLIEFRCLVPKSKLRQLSKFWVMIDLISKDGLIGQTLLRYVDHVENIENYYAPKSNILFKASVNKNATNGYINLSVRRRDTNIDSCQVYFRALNERYNPLNSQFSSPLTINFRDNQIKRVVKKPFPETAGRVLTARALPVTKTGRVYSNFDSSSITSGMFTQYRSSLYTSCKKQSIQIFVRSTSPDVYGIEIQRRNLTINEKSFKTISSIRRTETADPAAFRNTAAAKPLGTSPMKVHQAYDFNVTEGDVYEYRGLLHLKCGVSKLSSISRVQTYIPPSALVSLTFKSTIVTEGSANNSIVGDVAGRDKLSVTLQIGYELIQNDTQKLFEALNAVGLSDLFGQEISQIKSSLDNLIFFKVSRFNCMTGETQYLGVFSSTTLVVDDGNMSSSIAPVSNQIYIYRAEVCLVSPSDATSMIKDQIYNMGTGIADTGQVKNPGTIARMTETSFKNNTIKTTKASASIGFADSEAKKHYSKYSLLNGTLESSKNKISKSVLSDYPTGDFIDTTISTLKPASFFNTSVSFGNSHSGPILSWSCSPSASKELDFFIVIAKKVGIRTISGTAHCPISGRVVYADMTNNDFVGIIEYSIIPVFISGVFGQEFLMPDIILQPRETKFRRTL